MGYDTYFHIHNPSILPNNGIFLHCIANEIVLARPAMILSDLCTEAGRVFHVIQTFDNRWHNIISSSATHLCLHCSVSFPLAFVKQFSEPLSSFKSGYRNKYPKRTWKNEPYGQVRHFLNLTAFDVWGKNNIRQDDAEVHGLYFSHDNISLRRN